MATIKPIEGRSVHQIQSGQVIIDLCSVAKELVENALDAGATSVEVRFKNNGLDSIEVQDNGSGISPEDFETIALKHHTSKLATYDDLTSLTTFGFRGEALSSLCALSKFHIITTRASDGPKGTKLEFEQSGKLKGTSVVAAKQGTTVVVDTLFYNLPVRRKELEKTIKREYQKVLQLLHAYACISTGVKFSVSNTVAKGKKTMAFSTNSNPNTKENIANVYGAKTLTALIPLDLEFEMDPSNVPGSTQSARNWSTQEDPGSRNIKIVGHISRPVVGEGRQTPDRQMLFVNSRPCGLPQVSKAFNEVYKSYNITQSPFIFADIRLDTNAYDVNVSPDKREILLHDQTALLENLKNALVELFEGHDQSVPQAQFLDRKLPSFKPPTIRPRESADSAVDERALPTRSAYVDGPQLPPQDERSEPSSSSSSPEPAPQQGFIKASLIERFAGRDTEERVLHPPARRRKSVSADKIDVTDVPGREEPVRPAEGNSERAGSPLFELDEAVVRPLRPALELPRAVQDFNARIASQHAKQLAREPSPNLARPRNDDDEEDENEEGISAINQTPQKRLSQSTIQNAFDRMRPMRTPVQQATITIGDTTTVSTIGSETRAAKRQRVHTPKFSLSGTPLSQTPKKPLLLKSLRGFAAPGTQIEGSDEDDEGGEEDEGADSSMPDARIARSPSPQKRVVSKEIIGPSTDELYGLSSTPPLPPPPPPQSLDTDDGDDVQLLPQPDKPDDSSDDEYIDESEKKAREDAKIARMIAEAEEAAARPTELNLKRANKLFQVSRKKYTTLNLVKFVETSVSTITQQIYNLRATLQDSEIDPSETNLPTPTQLDTTNQEDRLSLTVTKSDFHRMLIIGQFNLGFILALRPPTATSPTPDLFIIDQHASDEKYNFERFSATTVLVSQRLVHPHPLEITAVEEEIILSNEHALTANGFTISIDSTVETSAPGGQRAKLTALPMSKEVTFTPTDLEELLALLLDNPAPSTSSLDAGVGLRYIPRPSKVRKLLASRACRSSIMIGKTLKKGQMQRVVRHMGEMEKPWSCPHGRPTMRHLYGLERWVGWQEGMGVVGVDEDGGGGGCGLGAERGGGTDWAGYLKKKRGG
ncbi:DNA mismatch repair protein MutL [Lophiostoma macrostomum CBS 122681]|uniref:DNA mismatch repair protein PMS1 n=1 Tax=Lophiostoma macrostomum CBS 122681 TaxID=1314788 RepID=A0A6A6THP4_9PLEO|nr:DNA mismatch repair protein MutL [Lophiostoma macrostomum CBS 122681]